MNPSEIANYETIIISKSFADTDTDYSFTKEIFIPFNADEIVVRCVSYTLVDSYDGFNNVEPPTLNTSLISFNSSLINKTLFTLPAWCTLQENMNNIFKLGNGIISGNHKFEIRKAEDNGVYECDRAFEVSITLVFIKWRHTR